jgi:hypothetical protein
MRRSRGNGGLHFLTILGISAIAIVCQAAPADVNLQIDHSDLRLRFSSSEASILLLPYLHDDTVWYKIQYLSFEEKKNMTESPRSVSKFGANFTFVNHSPQELRIQALAPPSGFLRCSPRSQVPSAICFMRSHVAVRRSFAIWQKSWTSVVAAAPSHPLPPLS